jgi:hypothetical protein
MPEHGRLLVIELVLPPGNDPSLGKLFDLLMLVDLGGRERTEADYRTLLAGAGFELTAVTRRHPSSAWSKECAGSQPRI